MFIPRRFAVVLLMGTALLPFSRPALAVDDDAKPSAQTTPAKKKASPSPTPKKSAQKTDSPAKHSPTPAAKTSPGAKKTDDSAPAKKTDAAVKKPDAPAPKTDSSAKKPETPAKKSDNSDTPARKKTKAKPKPATQKRPHAKPGTENRNADATPRRHTESSEPEKKPEKRPEPKEEPKPEPRPAPQENRAVAQPQANSNPPPILPGNNLTISKSGAQPEEPAEEPEQEPEKPRWWWPFGGGQHYKYLSRSVREAIDDAHVARHRWRYIVVHNSGTRQGSAKAFDFYHRHVRKMPNGLAYHFVIGNGTSTPDGSVEIGPRWVSQLQGGHVHSDYLNSIALGVCLVGDYNKDKPTQAQLEALDELVKYLRKRVGKTDHHLAIVKPHRDINPPQWPTDCPGDRFPYQWLSREFDDQ